MTDCVPIAMAISYLFYDWGVFFGDSKCYGFIALFSCFIVSILLLQLMNLVEPN